MTAADAAATLERFIEAAGARAATAVVDGEPAPVLVECERGATPQVTEAGVARPVTGDGVARPLPHVHRFPPLEVDASRAELTAPLGAVAHLAGAVRALAADFGGRSVVTVEWETTDPGAPLTIAAREGDPLVLALGTEQFEMPAAWP